jgi:Na+-driven multidrug efflux pump
MLLMPVMALGSVLAAYVGQNIGAGNSDRARQAVKVSRNLALGISVVGFLILLPIRTGVVSLLTNDPTTQELAKEYVFWVLLTQPLMALFQNYLSTFNGSGNTRYSFIMATVRLWVIRLPMILFMSKFTDLGASGIWYAMVISNLLILILGAWYYRKVDFAPFAGLAAEKE